MLTSSCRTGVGEEGLLTSSLEIHFPAQQNMQRISQDLHQPAFDAWKDHEMKVSCPPAQPAPAWPAVTPVSGYKHRDSCSTTPDCACKLEMLHKYQPKQLFSHLFQCSSFTWCQSFLQGAEAPAHTATHSPQIASVGWEQSS